MGPQLSESNRDNGRTSRLEPGAPATAERPYRAILRYARPYWKEYAAGAALGVLFAVVGMAEPLIIRAIVGRFERGAMTPGLLWILFGGLVAMAATMGVARFFQRSWMIRASRKAEYDLRNDYFRHVGRLSQAFFHRMKTGDIMARATNDMNYVRMILGPGIMGTVDLVWVPTMLGLMIYLSPRLTLYALLPMPFITLFVYGLVMYLHRQSEIVQEQFGVVNSRAQENLAGARVVKAYGIEDRERQAFREESTVYMRQNLRLAAVQVMTWPLIGFSIGLTVLFVIWRGGYLVIEGRIGLGDFTAFLFALFSLVWPVTSFGWILTLYQRGSVGMKRILEVMLERPEIADTAATRTDIAAIEGRIEFDNVTFGYGERPVLHEISFTVEAGQTVAVVGPTGSGKSTLVSLLMREYEPSAGSVRVDGIDVRRIPLRVLRDAIGYVPQDTFLFSESVGSNLALGRPEATREEMDFAADVAQFLDTVRELPQGYDTLLGERGINLSGGQKQRLAIARAIVRDPKILILDDALSSVDTHTEERILQGLKPVAAARTTLIISHRISSIRHADLILVLEDGRLVAQGRHDELVAAGGLYADLYERQLLEEELEETA